MHPSHDVCKKSPLSLAAGFQTFKIFPPLYPDWDRPFGSQNENKICLIIFVSKSNEHVVLSSDEISFVVDVTSFPNKMGIMAVNKTELSDFNWGFATLGNLHQAVNITFKCWCVSSVLFNDLKSYRIFRISNTKVPNFLLVNSGKNQLNGGKSTKLVSWIVFGSFPNGWYYQFKVLLFRKSILFNRISH